jgi:hypothetical protein
MINLQAISIFCLIAYAYSEQRSLRHLQEHSNSNHFGVSLRCFYLDPESLFVYDLRGLKRKPDEL